MADWFPPGTSYLSGGGLPDGPWPLDSPESQGMSGAILRTARGIQHGVCLRHGIEVFTWGDPDRRLGWSSCNRTWVDKQWGKWLMIHGMPWLDRDAADLPCASAANTPNLAALKFVLSYTSLPPVGDVWRYSCGDWWPWQAQALAELNGCADVAEAWALQLQPHLGGSTFQADTATDGTLRVAASCRDNARLGMLMLNGGVGTHGTRLCDSAYIFGGQAGGPNWDGHPNPLEGYQVHLCKNGVAWELSLPGIEYAVMARDGSDSPDHGHGVIFCEPAKDLIVCARGADPSVYLPTISSACF